jgi:hypothetical protein
MNPSLFLGSTDGNSRNTPPATNFVKPILSRVVGSTPTRFRHTLIDKGLRRSKVNRIEPSQQLNFADWHETTTMGSVAHINDYTLNPVWRIISESGSSGPEIMLVSPV